jgi:hypothetical protein
MLRCDCEAFKIRDACGCSKAPHVNLSLNHPLSYHCRMFVLGGVMVIINVVSTAGKIANTPAGTPAPPRGG